MKYKYKYMTVCNHPFFLGRRQVLRSRLVMAEHLGRSLLSSELVHHKNENTMDDEIDNLEIKSRGEHNTQHKKGKGRIFTVKHKHNLSVARKGQSSNRKGVHLTMETKKKMSLAQKDRWLRRKLAI